MKKAKNFQVKIKGYLKIFREEISLATLLVIFSIVNSTNSFAVNQNELTRENVFEQPQINTQIISQKQPPTGSSKPGTRSGRNRPNEQPQINTQIISQKQPPTGSSKPGPRGGLNRTNGKQLRA
jgi:hypothetical protein